MSSVFASAATTDADYRRLGMARDTIAQWEDGARTDNRPGTYEWWYFDAHLENGAKLVVVFMNKDLTTPQRPLEPTIRLNLDLPDGRTIEKFVVFPAVDWSASTDYADVQIAGNRFTGDLHTYRITASIEGIDVDVTLTGQVPAWRPETGYLLFGRERALEFAWLPSVPQGSVAVTYSVDGVPTTTTGVGYHDHNWGNVSLLQIIHDWYWGRSQAGPYSVIASFITAHERYGFSGIPVFMIARDGVVVADDATKVAFETDDVYRDDLTGKPIAGTTRYRYSNGVDRYVVTFVREKDLARARMADALSGVKRMLARIARFDGAYLRFTGTCTVQHYIGDVLIDEFSDAAIWESMYFGHAR